MPQLHLSDQRFYCLLRCELCYNNFDGVLTSLMELVKSEYSVAVIYSSLTHRFCRMLRILWSLHARPIKNKLGYVSLKLTGVYYTVCVKFSSTGGTQPPLHGGTRVIISSFWVIVIILMSAYSGNLLTYLAINENKLPFHTLEEAVQDENVAFYLPGNAVSRTLIEVIYYNRFTKCSSSHVASDILICHAMRHI